MLPPLRRLDPDEWHLLRVARLTALKDSPDAFLATYEREERYSQERWEAEFCRGDWLIGELGGKLVCMVGVTHESDSASEERYLEYVWVAPEYRRSRVAYRMLADVLGKLKKSGIRTVTLWVLDGNDVALRLYKRLAFQGPKRRQPLPDDPGRCEEQFRLDLDRY
jgi:ribosomal protein S18 acetylase RimI-like enzyme